MLPNSLGVPVCSAGRTTGGVGFAGLVAATDGVPDTGTVATDERVDGGGGSLAKLRTIEEQEHKKPQMKAGLLTMCNC